MNASWVYPESVEIHIASYSPLQGYKEINNFWGETLSSSGCKLFRELQNMTFVSPHTCWFGLFNDAATIGSSVLHIYYGSHISKFSDSLRNNTLLLPWYSHCDSRHPWLVRKNFCNLKLTVFQKYFNLDVNCFVV